MGFLGFALREAQTLTTRERLPGVSVAGRALTNHRVEEVLTADGRAIHPMAKSRTLGLPGAAGLYGRWLEAYVAPAGAGGAVIQHDPHLSHGRVSGGDGSEEDIGDRRPRPGGDFKTSGQRIWNPIESDFHSTNGPLRWRSARAFFSQND